MARDTFFRGFAEMIERGEFTPKESCGGTMQRKPEQVCGDCCSYAKAESTAVDGVNLPGISKHVRVRSFMRKLCNRLYKDYCNARLLVLSVAVLALAAPALAQANSPWENAVNVLQQAFTSTIARGLSLVAIVVSGLTFAFGEGGSKRVLAGVLFGVGMAIAAVNFLAWLFPA
jgi:type IV secretory pathway VirB2 component (pilin)